ncbi:putative defense protein 2 [Littorina saxatilis]|uniref:Reelin domain-containing protein n=1 Tax=Littorina saxatilis TaxID=31220 RepID=A0AAN9B6B1_9CAEN
MAALTHNIPLLLMVTIMLMMTPPVESFHFGAPNFVCGSMRPLHPGVGQVYRPDTFPFIIQLSPDRAMPGDIVTVTVSGKTSLDKLNGTLSTVRGADNKPVTGFLTTPGDHFKLLNCTSLGKTVIGSGITHTQRLDTSTTSFRWRVPHDAVIGSHYNVRLTIVQRADTFWVGINNTLTVGQPARTSKPLTTSTNAGSASSNTGNASRVPSGAGGTGSAAAKSSSRMEARPSSTAALELQHSSESNLIVFILCGLLVNYQLTPNR